MELFEHSRRSTRWASFENPRTLAGQGARENKGAKGRPAESLPAGETKTLLDYSGSGVIRRIWVTVSDRSPEMLRGLRLESWWEGADSPAVSAPLGDFFGVGLGRTTPFECELFSNPEGRSFVCLAPMPFRKHARIAITNETAASLRHLFYDVDLETGDPGAGTDRQMLYFHSHWRRENPTTLGQDFAILPGVSGRGRFLGCNVGVVSDPAYGGCWWGEGEVKIYLDSDQEFPTLVGTGAEDYIGTGWGQGRFAGRFQGCTVADSNSGAWCFYRYHVPDPVWFETGCRVVIQQIGGDAKEKVKALQAAGVPLIPVTVDAGGVLHHLLTRQPAALDDPALPDGWCNFYRRDDWSSTAYFYLDSPENGLPVLPPLPDRVNGISAGGD